MRDKPVYSTADGPRGKPKEPAATATYQRHPGPLKMRLETKGRGGKAVTVLFNLTFDGEAEALRIMKELQGSLGCGGAFKNGTIELRGDVRDRVDQYFARLGMKVVRAGG